VDIISYKFYEDPYQKELETTITACKKTDGGFLAVLQETIFYPTGGGQPHDTGFINDLPLLDVFEKDGTVYHLLPEDPGLTKAACRLNWERRFDHMQQHTGQHLLSAIFLDEYGWATESFHLGQEYCSIDLATAALSKKTQAAAEEKANALITANLAVKAYTVGKDDLENIPVRKLPPAVERIRIVEIDKIDYSPCAGTHVSRTGEIGSLKILRAEKYKGMARVYFLCGGRARRDYGIKHALISELTALFSAPSAELLHRAEAELEQKRSLEHKVQKLQSELLSCKAQEIASAADTSPLFIDLPQGSVEQAQELARKIFELGSFSLVITVGDRLVLAHNLADFCHCGDLVKEKALPLGGRGGGSRFSAQAYFPQPEGLKEFQAYLKKHFQIPS